MDHSRASLDSLPVGVANRLRLVLEYAGRTQLWIPLMMIHWLISVAVFERSQRMLLEIL